MQPLVLALELQEFLAQAAGVGCWVSWWDVTRMAEQFERALKSRSGLESEALGADEAKISKAPVQPLCGHTEPLGCTAGVTPAPQVHEQWCHLSSKERRIRLVLFLAAILNSLTFTG